MVDHQRCQRKSPIVGILVEAATAREDDESNLSVAEHGQFIGLFEQAIAALAEGHLPVGCVLYPLDFDLSPTHLPRPIQRSCFFRPLFA